MITYTQEREKQLRLKDGRESKRIKMKVPYVQIVEKEAFGDGTLKCLSPCFNNSEKKTTITWSYDDDNELFCLYSLVRDIQENYPDIIIDLCLPYIPHARQDRNVSGRLFTLKFFSELINSMNFHEVRVLDPHSDVATALINRVKAMPMPFLVSYKGCAVMYPDNGAAKKYGAMEGVANPIIGNKHRNTDGRIDGYELMNFPEGTKKVIIRDDICSYGGTFVAAAKELRKRGVEEITLVVSHCENNILKGEVFDYIDRVFTSDSICTVSHPKLVFTKAFRGESNV